MSIDRHFHYCLQTPYNCELLHDNTFNSNKIRTSLTKFRDYSKNTLNLLVDSSNINQSQGETSRSLQSDKPDQDNVKPIILVTPDSRNFPDFMSLVRDV